MTLPNCPKFTPSATEEKLLQTMTRTYIKFSRFETELSKCLYEPKCYGELRTMLDVALDELGSVVDGLDQSPVKEIYRKWTMTLLNQVNVLSQYSGEKTNSQALLVSPRENKSLPSKFGTTEINQSSEIHEFAGEKNRVVSKLEKTRLWCAFHDCFTTHNSTNCSFNSTYRFEVAKIRSLCFNCLHKRNGVKKCSCAEKCNLCGNWHHEALHDVSEDIGRFFNDAKQHKQLKDELLSTGSSSVLPSTTNQ